MKSSSGILYLMNAYEFFKFSTLDSISQYGNDSDGRERNNFQQLSVLIELKFFFTT